MKKTVLLIIFTISVIITITAYAAEEAFLSADGFAAGRGTVDDPYIISSQEELRLVEEYGCGDRGIGVYFKIGNDLNEELSAVCIGSEDNPFEGVFDGSSHEITAYSGEAENDVKGAIFAAVGKNGTVKNIHARVGVYGSNTVGGIAGINNGIIENCRVRCTVKAKESNAGGIVGENTGTIRQCSVQMAITRDESRILGGTGIGGICGFNNGGTVSQCKVRAKVWGSERAVGGIAGDNTRGIIEDCFMDAVLLYNKGSEIGGIAGRLNDGIIKNCLVIQVVDGTHCKKMFLQGSFSLAGLIAGNLLGDSSIQGCYALQEDYDATRPEIGSSSVKDAKYGYNRKDILDKSTYKDWDFENTWCIGGGGFPSLRCFYEFPDCIGHWACDRIEELYEGGVISGYEDGMFRPDEQVTRAEFIKLIVAANCRDVSESALSEYIGVPKWAQPYVAKAQGLGWLKNIAKDNILEADKPITRLEAGVISGNSTSGYVVPVKNLNFTDIDEIPEWAIRPLQYAYSEQYIEGYGDGVEYGTGSFRPYNTLTRAEAVSMIYRMNWRRR